MSFMRTALGYRRIIGVTGEVGSGKTYVCNKLVEIGKEQGKPIYNIELDNIGHKVLSYPEVVSKIVSHFGDSILDTDGLINRKLLGDIVFYNEEKLKILTGIMREQINQSFDGEIEGLDGLIIYNAALIAEHNTAHKCKNNIILIYIPQEVQYKRLEKNRGLSREKVDAIRSRQFSYEKKKKYFLDKIEEDGCGKLWGFDNSLEDNLIAVKQLFSDVFSYLIDTKGL